MKERDKLILNLHDQGKTNTEIGNGLILSAERVRQIIKANGGTSRQTVRHKNKISLMYAFLSVIGDEEKEKVVLGNIKKYNFIAWVKRNHSIDIGKIYKEKRLKFVLDRYNAGDNAKQIADALGYSRAAVLNMLHECGVYTKLSTEEIEERNKKIKELYHDKKVSRDDLAEMFDTSYANIGLILTDKHYVEYSPEYYMDRHKRQEETRKKKEELLKLEDMIMDQFGQHKSIPSIVTFLMKEKPDNTEKYYTNLCYRVLRKFEYGVGKTNSYKETYGLIDNVPQ